MKHFLVVAYDIVDDRRRTKVAKLLTQYGQRCNDSVFECVLSVSKIEKLKSRISQLANVREDVILYYYLCLPCVMKRESLGKRPENYPEVVVF